MNNSLLERFRKRLNADCAGKALEFLALGPPLLMVREVIQAPRMQFTDYFYALLRITKPDGSLRWGSLIGLHNEHPLALPSLLYWLDARFAGGDNRVLGVAVVVIAVGTLLALRRAIPASVSPINKGGLVLAFSALIFSLHGFHSFVRAMSGSAWLTANLLVVLSLLFAARSRWAPAYVMAILASISYGTGFAAWPALLAIALMRRAGWVRYVLPLGFGLIVTVVWLRGSPSVEPGGAPAGDLASPLYTFFTIVGHLWTAQDSGLAVSAGVLVIGAYGVLLTNAKLRTASHSFWWALACYAFVSAGMIATARRNFGLDYGLESRYTSLSVLAVLPLLSLLAVRVSQNRIAALRLASSFVCIGLLGFTLGAPSAATIRRGGLEHDVVAVALRAGVGDAFGASLPPPEQIVPLLREMNHYPFSEDFTLGCGGPELGSRLPQRELEPLAAPGARMPTVPTGRIDSVKDANGALEIVGWAYGGSDPIRCVLVVDGDQQVIGGGPSGLPRGDVARQLTGLSPRVGFRVVAPARSGARIGVLLDSGTTRSLALP